MKSKFLFYVILITGLILINFSVYRVYSQTQQNKPAKQQTILYTCPMHPEVVQNLPGNCPKCGMKLVEKKNSSKGKMHQAKDSCNMKHDHKEMKCDSTNMKKGPMMRDTTSMKHDHMKM